MKLEKLRLKLKFKNTTDTLIIGASVGIIALGLQNLNPFEPADITHQFAVFVGLCVPIIYLCTINLIVCIKNIWRLIKKKSISASNITGNENGNRKKN